MPCLTDIVVDLHEQVKLLTNAQRYHVSGQANSKPSSATSVQSSSDSDAESEMVSNPYGYCTCCYRNVFNYQ